MNTAVTSRRTFPNFIFHLLHARHIIIQYIPPRHGASAFFLFQTDVLFVVPDSLCPTKCPSHFRLSLSHSLSLSLSSSALRKCRYFFSSIESGDGRFLQYKTHEWTGQNRTYKPKSLACTKQINCFIIVIFLGGGRWRNFVCFEFRRWCTCTYTCIFKLLFMSFSQKNSIEKKCLYAYKTFTP